MPKCNGCKREVPDVKTIHYQDGSKIKRCDDCSDIVEHMLNTGLPVDPAAWGEGPDG